jgi:xanthine dehydrogenase accessory factor
MLRKTIGAGGAGRPFALALVISAEGSTPRGAGVRAIIFADGTIEGTIGGGAVEDEARRRAAAACARGRAEAFEADLDGGAVEGGAPICGGRMRVLLEPGARSSLAAFGAAAEALAGRGRGALRTCVRGGADPAPSVEWIAEGEIRDGAPFPGAEALRACLEREEARTFADERARLTVLVEPIAPAPRLLIAGGGHIGQALAVQAHLLGFDIAVVDDRPEYASPSLFPPGVETRCGDIGRELAAFPIGPDTSVVIVTRGHRHDAEALAACIRSPAGYIGMIGSRRKIALLREDFISSGRASAAEMDRIFAPIGLDIGAVTVPEIATSIAAQLVKARRKGAGAARQGGMVLR